MRFQARDVRLAFPDLYESRVDPKTGKKTGFGAKLILPPDHVQVIRSKPYLGKDGKIEAPSDRDAIIELGIKLPTDPNAKVKTIPLLQAIEKALAKQKWPDKFDAVLKTLKTQDKTFLHEGASKAEYDGFDGNYFLSANNKHKPSTYDQLRNEVDEASGVLYSGCFVVAIVDFWAQDHKDYGKRLNTGLRGVQKFRDGDAFGGGGSSKANDFDEISVDGEEGGEVGGDDSDDETDLTA